MGTQGRDDMMGTRNERNTTQSGTPGQTAAGSSGWNEPSRYPAGPRGWYERGRDDLRRRMSDRDRERGSERWESGSNRDSPRYAGGSEYDSYARDFDNREERPFTGAQGYGYGPSQQPQRGWDESRDRSGREGQSRWAHDREAQAYGDYGHPNTERQAYGDMGVGDRDRERRNAPAARGTLGDRLRRWRKGGQTARDVMTRNLKSARPTDTLQQVAQIMIDEDTGIVPVTDDEQRLLGVITDRDIVCRMVARGIDLRNAKATDAMTDDVECVTEQHSLHDVLDLMSDHQVRRVPVVARGDRLVGIISMSDIAREADIDEELQDTFEDISSRRGFWSRLR